MGRTPRVPKQLTARPFSLDEAREAGLSLSALRGKQWQRIGSRLYRWRGAADDKWSVIDGFWRTMPARAVFVGRTAAWMHGLDVEPANPVQVVARNLRRRDGLDVRQSDITGETMNIKGIPVTTLHRTLMDLCSWSLEVEALVAIDMAVRARLTDTGHLLEYSDQVKGHSGVSRLRLLANLAAPAESPMESRLRWLLVKSGLPTPQVQVALHDHIGRFLGRADLYYPCAHLVVEFDGANHRERLVADDRRQNLLVGAGYRILRFTTAELHSKADVVVAQVRAALGFRTFSP